MTYTLSIRFVHTSLACLLIIEIIWNPPHHALQTLFVHMSLAIHSLLSLYGDLWATLY